MMKKLLFAILLMSAGCSSIQGPVHNKPALDQVGVMHIVLIWLKEPDNSSHINKVVMETKKLEKIEDVQAINVGSSILSNRIIVDDSFDVGLSMEFVNTNAMERYLIHPEHIHAVKSILRPLTRKIVVYDILLR